MQPVPCKRLDIPEDNQPEKDSKLAPARSLKGEAMDTEKHVCHTGEKKNMAKLVGKKPFRVSMGLNSESRDCPGEKKPHG